MRDIFERPGFTAKEIIISGQVRGTTKATRIRPSDYGKLTFSIRVLAIALIDKIEQENLSHRTAESYATTIRRFGSFASKNRRYSNLWWGQDDGLFERCFREWEQDEARATPDSSAPAKGAERLLSLVRYVDSEFIQLGPTVMECVRRGTALRRIPDVPRVEFSNSDRLVLRDKAREELRSMERRLAQGRVLMQPGNNTEIGSVLEKLSEGSLTLDDLASEQLLDGMREAGLEIPDPTSTSSRSLRLLRTLFRSISPSASELLAFEILFLFETGWAAEEAKNLQISECPRTAEGRSYLKHKPRAHKSTHEHIVDTRGPWGANALFDRWLEATKIIRPISVIQSRDHLLILGRYDRQQEAGWRVDQPPAAMRENLKNWIAAKGLEVSEPHHIGRIRKTGKLIKAIKAGTLAGAAQGDHHVEIFKGHYLPTTTMYLLTPKILRDATDDVFERSAQTNASGPTVVEGSAAQAAEQSSLPEEILSAAAKTQRESEIDKRMLPVSCKNIFDSPYDGPGTLCSQRVMQCFSCENSIVFEDHLPRIISLYDKLESLREELPPPQFLADYGQTFANLKAVLDAFPDSVLEKARALSETEGLNFPLSMRIHLD